jgi:hypothetical protein
LDPFLSASIVSTSSLPDYTRRDISAEHDEDLPDGERLMASVTT